MPVASYRVLGGWSLIERSRYNTSTNNDPLGVQRALLRFDARLDLKPDGGPWTLSLFGRNVTDKKYKGYSVAAPLIRGGFYTYLSRGAEVGLRLSEKLPSREEAQAAFAYRRVARASQICRRAAAQIHSMTWRKGNALSSRIVGRAALSPR